MIISDNEEREIYFLIYFDEINVKQEFGEINFDNKEDCPKCIFTKKTGEKDGNGKLIKVFKYKGKTKRKLCFEFSFNENNFNFILDNPNNSFIFNLKLFKKSLIINSKVNQNKISVHDKMNYFIEALNQTKETEKLDILYFESINIFTKIQSDLYHFLINIFVHVYNTKYCSILLKKFSEIPEDFVKKDNIIKESLEQYKYNFVDICKNCDEIISSNKLDKINFYGLVLSYLNNYVTEKFNDLFNDLYKNDKTILFEILLKYKFYFKKQIQLDTKFLEELINFAAEKDFKEFKESGLFYLNKIDILIDIIEKSKEKIIEIKGFQPIEIGKIGNNTIIDFEKLIKQLNNLFEFSKDKKLLLINFNKEFWYSLSEKCSEANIKNIKISHRLREKVLKYYDLIDNVIKDQKDPIQKDRKSLISIRTFTFLIHNNIKSYVEKNKITNIEIIDLIKNYDIYYRDNEYKKKRDPQILNKIDIEKIDDEFIKRFEEMNFEKIFEDRLEQYLMIFVKKIQKITDFDVILKLIDIKKLGNKVKFYLKTIKNTYGVVIREYELSEEDNKTEQIQSISNLTFFICMNENDLEFLEKFLEESDLIDKKWKHKIYIELINLCKDDEKREKEEIDLKEEEIEKRKKKRKEIIKFLSDIYSKSLQSNNLNEFIEFLKNLKEEDSNDLIEHLNGKYIITKNEFYSSHDNLNVQLLNLIKKNLNLKNDNQYIEKNIQVLQMIYKDIDEKEIKYSDLNNFCSVQKDIMLEKLNILLLLKENYINVETFYNDLNGYYREMKDKLDKLKDYKNKLDLFHRDIKRKEISQINLKIEKILEGTYESFSNQQGEIDMLLLGSKIIVSQINDVKDSKIFNIFFRKQKNNKVFNKKDTPFDIAYSEFKKFKEELAEIAADFSKDPSKIEKIFKKLGNYYNDDEIEKELNSLIYGKGKKDEELSLIWNAKNYEDDLNEMFYFLNCFENVKDEVSKWKKECKDFGKKKIVKNMKSILILLNKEGLYDYTKETNKKLKSNYIQLFKNFYKKDQAIDFLYNHTAESVNLLITKIEPNNSSLINDVSDTLHCVGVFQELKEKKDLKSLIECIKLKLEDKKILNHFKNFSDSYESVINLDQNFDFSQHIYDKIEEIIENAKFIFNQTDDKFEYKKNEGYEIIKIEKIRELKNKIQIKDIQNMSLTNKNIEKIIEKYNKLKFFKILANNIEEIFDLMNILRTKGSTLPIKIVVEVNHPNIHYFLEGKKIEFNDLHNFLTNAKINIIKKLDVVYKEMSTIRFLYGKEIDNILRHIREDDYENFSPFLRYILNLVDCEIKVKHVEKDDGRKIKDYIGEYNRYNDESFDIIHNYIIRLFQKHNLTLEDHYINISIKKGHNLRGIYKFLSQSVAMEEDILQIFLDKIEKMPIAQNILINNKETTYEEMQAFFNRAILCKYNTLFVVEVNNSLSDNQQRYMNVFINNLLTYKNELYNKKNEKKADKSDTSAYMESCLVFIYNRESESFFNEFKYIKLKELKLKNNNNGMKRTITLDNLSNYGSVKDSFREHLSVNTHIIQSEICGLGKSTYIKNEIKKLGKKYFYFPLGGNLTRKKIYNKLEKIMKKIPEKNKFTDVAIHLDLFETKDNSILNEFLFSFLMTKFYSNNENIIYIPINIVIYVEIPNCFNNFMNKNKILDFFHKYNDIIKIDEKPMLQLPEYKIHLFRNMIDKKNDEEIFEWVKNNIKIKRYSYHQINIFINLFLSQYSIFNGTKLNFQYKNKDPKEVTKECIQLFAEGTKYFTYGGFSRFLLEGKSKDYKDKNEIDLLDEKYKDDLKNEKFDTKLIFIVKDKEVKENSKVIGKYYKLNISTNALKDGEGLGDLKDKDKRKEIMKYYPLEEILKIEFLEILKKILDLENPVDLDGNSLQKEKKNLIPLINMLEKNSNNDNDNKNEKNDYKYVLTIDNFRKMILILYRIIANIPVILMGETGCGKTALIKKLNQLLNNGQLTLQCINIDSSYDEEKLIKEMNDVNKNAKTRVGQLYWVFFDELNTCDSLALITEIFINRSFNGIKLEENIRLIGACNPYRRRKKGSQVCGLTYSNGDNNNDLVYLVNILPQSLIYYVFNFGSLEKENEDQYISSIISDTIIENKLREETKNIISNCHDYLRKKFDDSIVSLRELTRFKKIYNFFIEYYKKKNECLKKKAFPESEKLKSIIISIYLSYYIRLIDVNSRSTFNNEFKKYFKNLVNYSSVDYKKNENSNENDLIYEGELRRDLQENYGINNFSEFNFHDILSKEEDFILENVNPEQGIGKNNSLKENIFLLFTCLNTNIPLIIIGKPGSSKSLSAQLICKVMNGKYSSSEFFKLYPSIIQSYFQGSDSTTPGDVEGIFEIARGRLNALKKNKNADELPISMILFDELGLAERSKNNPLKALHSHLEFDGKEEGISFVGISNWTLDAAKINRALCLSVPNLDDDLEDIKNTSKSIAESINIDYGSKLIFEKILPNVYFNYKNYLKLLKDLTVYKKYELQEYKSILYKYREDTYFQEIFIEEEKFKFFFQKEKEGKEVKEEDFKEIFEYEKFKMFKDKIKTFLEEKKEKEKQNIEEKKEEKEIEMEKYYNEKGKLDSEDEEEKEEKEEKKEKEEKEEKEKKIKSILDSDECRKLKEEDKMINLEFHGNRDFYYLVKGIANELNENNNNDLKIIIKNHIERNFGGLEFYIDFKEDLDDIPELEQYKKYKKFIEEISEFSKAKPKNRIGSVLLFKIIYNLYCNEIEENDYVFDEADKNDYNYINNIVGNIKDHKSRYLLLAVKPSLSKLIKEKIRKEANKGEVFFIEGSQFPYDDSNEYQFKKISQIQGHAEKDDILMLHNLKQIYAFLYDLFNKNFIKKDGKNYARICQGNFSDQLTLVNEAFKVIILVNKKYLNKVEPPFISRFEKMILYFSEMMKERERNIADDILKTLDMKKVQDRLIYKIQYELEDLLIGCKKDDILGMVYYELDSNENKNKIEKINDVKKIIFNKIYKLLPQDIIVNLNKDNDLRKLYDEHKTYYNLKSYIDKDYLLYKISIIYTFNSITGIIEDVDDSLRFKIISDIKSELQLENSLNSMIYEKNKNKNKIKYQDLIFIHFTDTNSKKISFLINFIQNNYYKIPDIKFIFIVHIRRNFIINKNEKEISDKIYSVPDIDPSINQLFIDNLNGPKIQLKEILSNPFESLKGLIKIEEEFMGILKQFVNENLKELFGEDNTIKEENYSENLEIYFEKNRNLLNSIIKKIKAWVSNDKEFENIVEKIYKLNYINKSSVDFITVIIDYVKNKIISKYIILILGKLEDNNILTTLLFINKNKNLINDEFNDIANEIVQKYLENIEIDDKDFEPIFSLNFVVPGFFDFYSNLSNFINHNIKNDYIKNEKKIRIFLPENSKENSYDIKENFIKKKNNFITTTFNEIKKNEFVFEFINKINPDLLLKDYITFFLLKKYLSDNEHENDFIYKLLYYNDYRYTLIILLLEYRFEKEVKIESNEINLLLLKIIWIEANQDYIIKILKIYDILANIFNYKEELLAIIKKTLAKENFRYITNEKKNPEITSEVNECYYKILASICFAILPPNIDLKQKIELFDYIDWLKIAMKIIKSLNDELIIYSIEVVLIEELIQIYDIISLNSKMDYELLNTICNSLKKNNMILWSNVEIQSEKLKEEYKCLITLLKKTLKHTDIKYYDLLKFIYFKETKKVYNVIYRTEIFQDIIKDNEIIVNSNDILQVLLFVLVKPSIDSFHESLNNLLFSTDFDVFTIIEVILKNKNEDIYYTLSDTLLYYFEKNSLMYFNNIFLSHVKFENKEEKKEKEKVIYYGPLKLFKDCVIFLNLYKKGSFDKEKTNKNLAKLFCIGYIKSYCFKYIDLFESNSPYLEKDIDIISEVNNSKSLSKIISFYIWKIIYYKNNKNIDIFLAPGNIKKYKFNEYKCFKKIEPNINPFIYNYINPKIKEIYGQFCEVLEKYKDKDFEDVKIEEFMKNEIDIDIFYYSSSNLILSNLKNKYALESKYYKNFFKNVCIPLFKNKEKIFNAIKILYDPFKFKKLSLEYGITHNNLGIILHSFRYFVNELNSNSKNSIYSPFYSRYLNLETIDSNYYPGNDIRDISIYSIFSLIEKHFSKIPNEGCFVCFCNQGGYYHRVKEGIPKNKDLNMKCKSCGMEIGAKKNNNKVVLPIKRKNYYRIFKTKEQAELDAKKNSEKYNCMSLDEAKEKYLYPEFKKEKGITSTNENFLKKNDKIVRKLSNISYRVLNFILYSHLFFTKIYNSYEELDIYLPKDMNWIQVITKCWEMVKFELNKLEISSIDIFMNYIFSDLFSMLNKHNILTTFKALNDFELELDLLISDKILSFKEEYKKVNNLTKYDPKDKYFFQNVLNERYTALDDNEYPYYNYFYYSEYVNEDYLLSLLNNIEKEKYPVLLKLLESNNFEKNKNPYSLEYLPIFNEVLNLFNDKYSYSIKREKANTLRLKDLKDEDIYLNNKHLIKIFMNFYNSLKLKNESNDGILELTENNKLSDFFIDDNNEIGKSYKSIYYKFIELQNNEISELLEKKIEQNIFENNCKNKINIQSADPNEIFILNLPDKFSLVEVIFNSSFRKYAITKNFETYNQIEIHLDDIENRVTELLLTNKKLFDNSIINFVYQNEDLEFENKNIITIFNEEYELKDIDIRDKMILYKFYDNDKNTYLFQKIIEDFIQLIIFLNKNKKLLKEGNKNAIYINDNNKIYEIINELGDKVKFNYIKDLFKDKDTFLISKTSYLFEFFRNLVFEMFKLELKAFQTEIKEEEKKLIDDYFKSKKLITKDDFKYSIRSFIILFLNLDNDKENNIKENQNNIINYLDIPDIWHKNIYENKHFHEELEDLKRLNIKMNQIIFLYDYLGDDINDDYFKDIQDVKRAVEKEREKEKEIENKKKDEELEINQRIIQPTKNDSDDDDDDDFNKFFKKNNDDLGDRDYV